VRVLHRWTVVSAEPEHSIVDHACTLSIAKSTEYSAAEGTPRGVSAVSPPPPPPPPSQHKQRRRQPPTTGTTTKSTREREVRRCSPLLGRPAMQRHRTSCVWPFRMCLQWYDPRSHTRMSVSCDAARRNVDQNVRCVQSQRMRVTGADSTKMLRAGERAKHQRDTRCYNCKPKGK
jgi:hypothetical protein